MLLVPLTNFFKLCCIAYQGLVLSVGLEHLHTYGDYLTSSFIHDGQGELIHLTVPRLPAEERAPASLRFSLHVCRDTDLLTLGSALFTAPITSCLESPNLLTVVTGIRNYSKLKTKSRRPCFGNPAHELTGIHSPRHIGK